MENKLQYQSQLFSNRLKKKYKELRKWARKNRITSYRLYDKDIPEIPVSVDLYEFLPSYISTPIEAAKFLSEQNEKLSNNDLSIEKDIKQRTYAVLYLYERPYQKDDSEEDLWLDTMASTLANVLCIENSHVISKRRKHQKGKAQYEKENSDVFVPYEIIAECGSLFKINLNSYLDNGLFFDHRPLRNTVCDTCSNKSVLNLFCYTGSFSVYAAQGNAKLVESVDLSNTYLSWARENLENNGFTDSKKYIFTRKDCKTFLQEKALAQKAVLSNQKDSDLIKNAKTYDIIILDPPTFSNSKNTHNVLDINKDWPQLVKDCLNILNDKGTLYFSTNSERLKFEPSLLPPKTLSGCNINVEDITQNTIPQDFQGSKPHRCWKMTLSR